jgi:hypothetical protein
MMVKTIYLDIFMDLQVVTSAECEKVFWNPFRLPLPLYFYLYTCMYVCVGGWMDGWMGVRLVSA